MNLCNPALFYIQLIFIALIITVIFSFTKRNRYIDDILSVNGLTLIAVKAVVWTTILNLLCKFDLYYMAYFINLLLIISIASMFIYYVTL